MPAWLDAGRSGVEDLDRVAGDASTAGIEHQLQCGVAPGRQQRLRDPKIAWMQHAPRDFRASVATLAPGADIALQAPLSTGSSRVSGFTVEVFYP